jgi:flavin-dependent dehydrogenase
VGKIPIIYASLASPRVVYWRHTLICGWEICHPGSYGKHIISNAGLDDLSPIYPLPPSGADDMPNEFPAYDIVVVGAGPAGLSAARTAARLGFRTLVVEQLAAPFRSMRGWTRGRVAPHGPSKLFRKCEAGSLYFPQIDLGIPTALMTAYAAPPRCFSPTAGDVSAAFIGQDAPAALVDGAGVLNLLAGQTAAAGADFLFDTMAVGLLHEGSRVVGVRTSAGNVRAELVIAAEGSQRGLCEEAGLYGSALLAARYALVVTEEVDAPAVKDADVGQIVTLGSQHPAARESFGSLIMPAAGRAIISFMELAEDPGCATADSARYFLNEYRRDPRVRALLADAVVRVRTSRYVPFGEAPIRVTADGFMGTGDAITPAGGLGLLPAVYLGRQAALIGAEAMDGGGASAARLAAYDWFCRQAILPGLEEESRALAGLLALGDAQIDALAQMPGTLRLALPNLGARLNAAWEPITWSEQPPSIETPAFTATAQQPAAYGWLKEAALAVSVAVTATGAPVQYRDGHKNGFSMN